MNFNHLPVTPLRITSAFGPRNTGIAGASTYHKGIDLGGNKSLSETPITAVRRGVITKNYWNDVRGWVVIIKHDETYSTLYQHLKSQSPLSVGTEVLEGDTIGIMGNSSKTLTIATHLHMELWQNGTPIDPEPYLKNIKGVEEDMTTKELNELVDTRIKAILKGSATEPSSWARESWEQAQDDGITDGSRPDGYAKREDVITMIERAIK